MLKETANAIWKHCIMKRLIDKDTALKLYKAFINLVDSGVVVIESENIYLERAINIALETSISVYDALYI